MIYINSRDEHGLILVVNQHVLVCVVNNSEDMRRHLGSPFTTVHGHHFVQIDGQKLVRVYSHAEKTGISVN